MIEIPAATDIRIPETRQRVMLALSKLHQRYKTDWKPEDVFAECVNGKAELFENKQGFIILKVNTNRFNLHKTLFIWILHSYQASNNVLAEERYFEWLKALAKDVNAKSIQFETYRAGYERILPKEWQTKMISYSWSVE
ncbi:hypothetical protein [Aliikangiella coralliicola]|uniref:Uncharacterized protein n=1 Tax=Aliikangiella coralliicola TaxID=2592383 RepID=A0A545U071_9GAMM|nr:hypothetical protein [Aliikangiella coralliicola]TQV82865.1 hypothetical protein FLL46_24150 [Aliikangiella coralliicola]